MCVEPASARTARIGAPTPVRAPSRVQLEDDAGVRGGADDARDDEDECAHEVQPSRAEEPAADRRGHHQHGERERRPGDDPAQLRNGKGQVPRDPRQRRAQRGARHADREHAERPPTSHSQRSGCGATPFSSMGIPVS